MTSDSAHIAALLNEPSRFGDLFRRHAGSIFRYASRRLNASAAEDVLSDTFVVAFGKRARLNHACESALPWHAHYLRASRRLAETYRVL